MPLVINRRLGERIRIRVIAAEESTDGQAPIDITIEVVELARSECRLSILAPDSVVVVREGPRDDFTPRSKRRVVR